MLAGERGDIVNICKEKWSKPQEIRPHSLILCIFSTYVFAAPTVNQGRKSGYDPTNGGNSEPPLSNISQEKCTKDRQK